MSDAPQLPEHLRLELERKEVLRYGENPHQAAALYRIPLPAQAGLEADRPGVANARKVQGKELSYNNLLDADAAFECVAEFDDPAIVIVKHTNPCGAALGESLEEAYQKALQCDPVSAFGGIVAANSTLNAGLATELIKIFLEVVIAPAADEDALSILSTKPNLRVLLTGGMPASPDEPASRGGPDVSARRVTVRSIAGGFLVQSADNKVFDGDPRVVTKRSPSAQELADMEFAFTICKHVKSNAIVYAKDGATVGIGAGQMSRVISAKIAAMKAADAKLTLKGSVMASDAFFPFRDSVDAAHEAGATAIIQPGGSLKDQESVDAADEHGMAMVFTGMRHFRH